MVVAGDRLGERPGQKEKLGVGIKKAQNGIKIKSISTTTSAGSKKKISVLVNRNYFSNRPPKNKEKGSQVDRNMITFPKKKEKRTNSLPPRTIPTASVTGHLYGGI